MGASVVVKMDSDGQMSPDNLMTLVEPILSGYADYAKGNRFFHTREIRKMPFTRRVGNLGLSFLTKIASGYWNIFDPTNGYIAISTNVFRNLDQNRINRRYFFETSLLFELSLARAVVIDIPMPARYHDEISSLSTLKSLFEFSYYLIHGMLRRLWLQYFVMDFSIASLYFIIGFVLCLFGGVWGVYAWQKSNLTHIAATTGTVMIAVLPVILGFQLLIQALAYDVQNVPKTTLYRPTKSRKTAIM